MSEIKYEKASFQDFQAIKDLMLTGLKEDPCAFSVTFEEYNKNSEYWWQGYVNPFVIGLSQEMILAKYEKESIGMAGLIYDDKIRKKHTCSLVWVYVNSSHRGQGIGKKLVEEVLEYAKKREGIKKITLFTNETQTAAINIYKKFGFEETGRLKKELNFDGKLVDSLIMEKEI